MTPAEQKVFTYAPELIVLEALRAAAGATRTALHAAHGTHDLALPLAGEHAHAARLLGALLRLERAANRYKDYVLGTVLHYEELPEDAPF